MDNNPYETDDFPRQGISRIKTVCKMTGLSKSTIYKYASQGLFPKPIKLSSSMSAWRNADILDWIDSLSHSSDSQTTAITSPKNIIQ